MSDAYGREYTSMVAWVVRLSGGRIRDARQASIALLILSAIVVISALMVSFWSGTSQNALPDNFNKIDQSQYAIPQ